MSRQILVKLLVIGERIYVIVMSDSDTQLQTRMAIWSARDLYLLTDNDNSLEQDFKIGVVPVCFTFRNEDLLMAERIFFNEGCESMEG